ncbi:uncharacterized protein LY89DRAFT_633257 [Mollisia scopiformis]|uniref:Uncharacterized protein n=1 Tax=Mollisia scopiformis TaxID=149040 RepID=A0A132B1N2_MOLSC|nr:uncharacterized protein LY89DRAFT_633257 [Mollisia scopiformis]KUJ06211.1 hypothetical protein LY89DRAFT_633257 [Mollisia scopiformis]
MTVNIIKTKFVANVGCFEVNDGANDEDAEEIEANIRVITKQRNHRWPYPPESACFNSVEGLMGA